MKLFYFDDRILPVVDVLVQKNNSFGPAFDNCDLIDIFDMFVTVAVEDD